MDPGILMCVSVRLFPSPSESSVLSSVLSSVPSHEVLATNGTVLGQRRVLGAHTLLILIHHWLPWGGATCLGRLCGSHLRVQAGQCAIQARHDTLQASL